MVISLGCVMKPHKASIKLAGLYLAVMMAISLFFSINVYRLSVQEFNRDLRGQRVFINRAPDFGATVFGDQFLQDREQAYSQAKDRILSQLLITNLVILVGGGFLCYYLARRTLIPIEEAHEGMSRFTADASHELRTPIAAMQTETEVALMDPKLTLEQAKKLLKSNLEELAKLTSLSESLLKLARQKENGLNRQNIDLGLVVTNALQRVLPAAEKKHIFVEFKPKLDVKIFADGSTVTEAIATVLDNAIKYSPPKTKVVVVLKMDHSHAVIEIKDQGAGIEESQLPYVFDRFYRGDSARSKNETDGYGLGLAIAKNIMDLNHGSISVASKVGKGSTFTMRLPLQN